MRIKRFLGGGLRLVFGLFAVLAAPALAQPGKLVIAGGAITTAKPELWQVMLAERLTGRPIGIVSTASAEPAATGKPLAAALNAEHGDGTAVFVPLAAKLANAGDPALVALIASCGGFYFTGGSQTLTTQALLQADGSPTPALLALRTVHAAGGVIGGSSAGAAIMSDPMITGGVSREALKKGVSKTGDEDASKGVALGRGLGFSPGILYCQHHLERGRFGRLLVALASSPTAWQTGFGISEDTLLVVDHVAQEARVRGARDVLYLQAARANRTADGHLTGVTLAYLTPGDRVDLTSGEVRPAPDKIAAPRSEVATLPPLPDAWARSALRGLLQSLSEAGPGAYATARDTEHEIVFKRLPESTAWRTLAKAEGGSPGRTLTGIAVEVKPLAGRRAE